MAKKTIVRKPFFNKRNKQFTIVIPKKEFKKIDPTIKFDKNLFVELSIFKKKGGK